MLTANKENALHKSVMLRVLISILDDSFLSKNLYFKGGTCSSMLGYLDRFSVDLDFDLKELKIKEAVQEKLQSLFKSLDLTVKDSSKNVIQYYLKYQAPEGYRNTLKIDAVETPYKNSQYETILLSEINRYAICQTKETLFANKLVAIVERYDKSNSIAGRDLYDIHHFLQQGFDYNKKLIEERRKTEPNDYIRELIVFIEKNITQTIIDQDLNTLLEYGKFNAIRKTLKTEVLVLLKDKIR